MCAWGRSEMGRGLKGVGVGSEAEGWAGWMQDGWG